MEDICIYVANHRDAEPLRNAPYRLLRVGSSASEAASRVDKDISCDSAGDNIAFKNFAYCELTGLYWIWKNTVHEITGLMHYRRYLTAPDSDAPLGASEIEQALGEHDVLVPRPAVLNCSVAEHYCFCHVLFDYLALEEAFEKQSAEYREAFRVVMGSDMIVPCNILIARKKLFDSYCEWLFDVLGECEKRIDLYAGRDDYQRRVFGFLAERLLMVWIVANDLNCGLYDVLTLGEAETLHDVGYGDYPFDFLSCSQGIGRDRLFDDAFYRKLYEDVASVYPEGRSIEHYLEYGIKEGRAASICYSMDEYANLRPYLRSKIGEMSPRFLKALSCEAMLRKPVLSRNIVLGVTRNGLIDYSPVYDWLYYTGKYDDVPSDYFHTELALRHFIEVGIPEGRQGSKGFSLDAYKEKNPDLVGRFGEDNRRYYRHYIRNGARRHPINWDYVD